MMRRLGLLLVLPLVIGLAACGPTQHISLPATPHPITTHPTGTITTTVPTTTATPLTAPAVVPTTINPADYLIDGTPHVPDADGEWFGEWAFFTDSTKRVWCEMSVFSGDGPGASCSIVPGATAAATYPIPASVKNKCDNTDGIETDGYGLGPGLDLQADPTSPEAGWAGCSNDFYIPSADLAKSKVLPDGGTLAVDPFSCHVVAAVATCTFNDTYDARTGTITMGMNVASFSQT
jgi:hypothetical protein